jgi:hypothetical protein
MSHPHCTIADMTEFEVYRKDRTPANSTPSVTVTQRGQISVNDAAFAQLGSPKAVELLYSRADRIIGLRPVDPDERHAYVPRTRSAKYNGHGPYVVSGSGFFSYFGIEVSQTMRYAATVEDGILRIDLNDPDPKDGRRKRSSGPR